MYTIRWFALKIFVKLILDAIIFCKCKYKLTTYFTHRKPENVPNIIIYSFFTVTFMSLFLKFTFLKKLSNVLLCWTCLWALAIPFVNNNIVTNERIFKPTDQSVLLGANFKRNVIAIIHLSKILFEKSASIQENKW